MRRLLMVLAVLALLVAGGRLALRLESVQDAALGLAMNGMVAAAGGAQEPPNGLRVQVCGSASPLGVTDQAQACIAIVTPDHFYLIDSGAGSTANLRGLPMVRLQGILLTHFHSDHIAEIYEVNLNSWVAGRPAPLLVYGPEGIDEVIDGVNTTYRQDRKHRVAHHGMALLPPAVGVLQAREVAAGLVFEDGDLKVTAYVGDHAPVHPAVGYRIEYRGRSVVVSGDSNVTAETRKISEGVDLLLHDALSVPLVTSIAAAMGQAGVERISKIATDVLDYHASTESLIELGTTTDIGMVAFYHLVPSPPNFLFEAVFRRGLPSNFVLVEDGTWFELSPDSDAISVHGP